ncbi:hypothetical protein [Streptomyces sp. NPDC002588]
MSHMVPDPDQIELGTIVISDHELVTVSHGEKAHAPTPQPTGSARKLW